MIFLKIITVIIIVTMIAVTTMASLKCSLFAIPPEVTGHPWFVATMFDAYFGFLTFYLWVFYKEKSVVARILWFIAIMALGNMAMSLYLLIKLLRLPKGSGPKELLLRNES